MIPTVCHAVAYHGTPVVPHVYHGIPWYDNMVPVRTIWYTVVVLWYTMVGLHLCGTTAIPWCTMVYHGNTMVIPWYFSSRECITLSRN